MKNDELNTESTRVSHRLTPSHSEGRLGAFSPGGRVTAAIETQTGKLPFVSWLGLSVISMAASATIVATRKREHDVGSFVGLWAPCFLLMGVYSKLVAIERRMTAEHAHMPEPNADVPSSTAYLS